MKLRRPLPIMLAVLLTALLSACGSSKTSTTVTVAPSVSTVILGGTQQFSASVSGPSDTTVSWSVAGSGCSGTACGTIDTNGLYTAPQQMISSGTATITATSNADPTVSGSATVTLDSGVRVQISPTTATLGSDEYYNFTATVSGSTNTAVDWTVNGTPNGDSNIGQVCVAGSNPCQTPTGPESAISFLAPSGVLGTAKATLAAVSEADSTQKASVDVTIMPAVAPVVASISPPATAQGAVMQEVYVSAESPSTFFSTSTVLANGQPVPTTFINTALLRGQVPAARVQSGQPVQIAVEAQNGQVSNSIGLSVKAVRPSIISFSPVSVPQCPSASCGPSTVTLDGGYLSPSTQVSFDGQSVGATLNSPNQIAVSIPGSALQTAGLYQLTLSNSGAALPESALNVAVEPAAAVNPVSIVASSVGVGTSPSAVAVDESTGVAVVANSGSNSISLIDLAACSNGSCPAPTSVPVGNDPTGVAVDPLRQLAIVVNRGDNTLSLVDLNGVNPPQTINLPAGYVPFSVGENPLTGHALVANQSTNTVTVVDLTQSPVAVTTVDVTQGGTRPGGMGADPQVSIEPRLDWAIVTPGGAGAITAIDMSHKVISPVTAQPTFNVVFSFAFTTSVTGIGLNAITDDVLITDPNSGAAAIFSLLNESVRNVLDANNSAVGFNYIASAVNPLTNVGVLVNRHTNVIQLVDMRDARLVGSAIPVGTTPVSVALDDVSDQAVVVNQGDSSVTVVSLGALRPLAVTGASASRLFTSSSSQTLTLLGGGFASGASVRVDGTALPSGDVNLVSGREIDVTIPASPFLTGPRILNLDVQNSGGTISNVFQIPVIQSVPVGNAPIGVAVDPASNMAVVTNNGSATVSLVDLSSGTVTATVDVGASPTGVAVLSRSGQAVVTNSADDTVSLVDLCTAASANASSCTPSASTAAVSSSSGTVQQPVAVAVDPDSGVAAVADEQSDAVSFLDALGGAYYRQLLVDTGPIGVAIDPNTEFAAVLCATQSPPAIDIVNLQNGVQFSVPVLSGHVIGANLPTGIALDPVNNVFLVADSTGNRILVTDPESNKITQNISTGINPTSIAYNFNAREALTVNTDSHTASLVEVTPAGSEVRAILLVDGSSQQSVAINPLTNVAVVADQSHNQLLLIPLGH